MACAIWDFSMHSVMYHELWEENYWWFCSGNGGALFYTGPPLQVVGTNRGAVHLASTPMEGGRGEGIANSILRFK